MNSEVRAILSRKLRGQELPGGIAIEDWEAPRCQLHWRAVGAKRPRVLREAEGAAGLLLAIQESYEEYYAKRFMALENTVASLCAADDERRAKDSESEDEVPVRRGPGRPRGS